MLSYPKIPTSAVSSCNHDWNTMQRIFWTAVMFKKIFWKQWCSLWLPKYSKNILDYCFTPSIIAYNHTSISHHKPIERIDQQIELKVSTKRLLNGNDTKRKSTASLRQWNRKAEGPSSLTLKKPEVPYQRQVLCACWNNWGTCCMMHLAGEINQV